MANKLKPQDLAALQAVAGQQNLVDRVITYFAPAYSVRRLAARGLLAVGGGYTGGQIDRASLSRWRPGGGSPTTDIVRDLPMLRRRSRDQMRNAPVAVGALETVVAHVVGTGLSLKPGISPEFLGLTPEAAEEWVETTARRFSAWAASSDCDAARQLNFFGLQELAFRSAMESGDAFVLTPRLPRAGRDMLTLQLIEADRVSNPNFGMTTPTLIDGIEINVATGEPIAVHISEQHPGDVLGQKQAWVRRELRGARTGRRNVLHVVKLLRPGQKRGVPWVAPILEPLKQLSRYTDAELNAAVVSSVFSVFIKMDPQAFQDIFDEDAQAGIVSQAGSWSGEMESGKAINLLPGESIEAPTPGRPSGQFDPFVTSIMRQIGMALQLPYEVLVMHFQSSYSAARGALLLAWRLFRSRRDWLVTTLCQPVYELWLEEEVAAGRIAAPGFFADPVVRAAWCAGQWIGDGPGSIDPGKEVAAAQSRVDMGISTLDAESILHDGIPWADKQRQRAKEVATQRRDGTLMTPNGAPPSAPASPAAPDGGAAPGGENGPADENAEPVDPTNPAGARLATLVAQVGALAAQVAALGQSLLADQQQRRDQLAAQHTAQIAALIDKPASAVCIDVGPAFSALREAVNADMGEQLTGRFAPLAQSIERDRHLVVNVPAPVVNVAAPVVAFEATVPPAQVIVNSPTRSVARIERNAEGEIVQTVTTHHSA